MSLNIAILGSTRGSNLEPLFHLIETKQVRAKIVLVISDRENALILARAKCLGIPTQFLAAEGLSRAAYGEKLTALCQQHRIDLIVLIGFMRILAATFTEQWAGHIINVHPSLLPKHAGLMDLQVHEAVLAAGDTESGCTVHLVDEHVDAGKILVQKRCLISPGETAESLKTKVQALEVTALLDAIELFTMQTKRSIHTALISLSDKTNLLDFAQKLHKLGVTILSTGGTAKVLAEAKIPFTKVADITNFPEIMDGRVKTLHPKIHGGILGKRDAHKNDAKEHDIAWIDLVVVNLYPFEATVASGADFAEVIENIDIGGPAMLRAAAKNHEWVTVVHDCNDYTKIIEEMEQGGVTSATRQKLAAKAFAHTAYYDAVIAQYLQKQTSLLEQPQLSIPLKRLDRLRYGENPHQAATLFQTRFGYGLAQANILQGKALSYNNLVDAEAALQCVQELQKPAAVVVKHANPCGVAASSDIDSAYQKAFAADSQSAFGGIIALNRPCTATIAEQVAAIFMEVILAPDFSEEALTTLRKKPNLRVIAIPHWEQISKPYAFRAISGGLLLQTSDQYKLTEKDLHCKTKKKPSPAEITELLFAWILVKHLKSNAIAISKNHVSVGLSGGQVSRIAALKCALQRAGGNCDGAVLASDAFFPFRDSIDALSGTGIRAIIQPGGSIRDEEVIAACDEYGIAMVFTNIRCFNH